MALRLIAAWLLLASHLHFHSSQILKTESGSLPVYPSPPDEQAAGSRDEFSSRRPRQVAAAQSGPLEVRILALFSGASRDLDLDHRLGRQVLKLAAVRARRLNPEISNIRLQILNDEADCRNGSQLTLQLAEMFYAQRNEAQPAQQFCTHHETCATTTDARAHIDAILGPSCDQLVDQVARMAAYWHTPIYSVSSISGAFARKDIYSTLTRLSPSIDHFSMFLLKVMERFKWRHLAVVIDPRQAENVAILKNLDKTIEQLRYTIPIHKTNFEFDSFSGGHVEREADNTTAAGEPTFVDNLLDLIGGRADEAGQAQALRHCTREARETLAAVRRKARVVLLLLDEPLVVRRLLLCAHELRMNNGEHTFLALDLGLKSTAARAKREQNARASGLQNFDWFVADDEENNPKARQMFESLMVLSVELPVSHEFDLFVEQTLDMARQDYPGVQFERSSVGSIAVALHDSLLLAVEAQKRRLLPPGRDQSQEARHQTANRSNYSTDGDGFFEDEEEEAADEADRTRGTAAGWKPAPLMWNERYSGGLITSVHINARGDQELDYVLSDMEPELGIMRPVASYAKDTRQVLALANSYVHWPARLNAATRELLHNDEPPPDEPECGFTGEAERCIDRHNLYVALSVVAVFLAITVAVVALSVHRYRLIRYQMQLDDYWWKINWSDLHFLQPGQRHKQASLGSQCGTSLTHQMNARALGGDSLVSSADDCSLAPDRKPAPGKRSAVPLIVTTTSSIAAAGASPEPQGACPRAAPSVHGSQLERASLLEIGSNIIHSELSNVVRQSSLALYRGELVIVKQLNGRAIEVTRPLLVELKRMRELANENLARLIGLCLEPEHLSVVYEFCSRGNLQDLLLNPSIAIDWNLRYSIIGDLINGLNFIHTTLLDCHGRLKSTNLVLDSRFTLKLTDFGMKNLYNQLELIERREDDDKGANEFEMLDEHYEEQLNEMDPTADGLSRRGAERTRAGKQRKPSAEQTIYNMDSVSVRGENLVGARRPTSLGTLDVDGVWRPSSADGPARNPNKMRLKNRGSARFFWTAPEHLRQRQPHLASSKRGDIYSLAIILYEICTRKEPYYYGTNAKPRWKVIKEDKLLHQRRQKHAQQTGLASRSDAATGFGSSVGTSASRLSISAGSHLKSSSGSGVRKQRRSQASVAPLPGVDELDDSGGSRSSFVQVTGLGHCGEQPQTDGASGAADCKAASSAGETVKISFSSLGLPAAGVGVPEECETIGEELADDELGSVVSGGAPNLEQQRQPHGSRGASSSVVSHDSSLARPGQKLRNQAADEVLDAEEILDQLRMGVQPEPVRPYIPNYLLQDVEPRLIILLHNCWHETPSARPSAGQVRNSLRRITKGATAKNYLENLLDRLQTYAAQLERIVDGKSADIMREKMRTEELLYQLVPRFVADKLKHDEPVIPQVFDGVTIFFSDIVGFEKYASVMSPSVLVDLLNSIYSSFDSIISSFDVTKIEVILDQFLVAAGICLEQQQQSDIKAVAESGSAEQKTSGGKESGQAQQKGRPPRLRRRLLGGLRSQSSGEKGRSESRAGSRSVDSAGTNQESAQTTAQETGQQFDQFKRTSAEQIARMALCIRDLVRSFHFHQNSPAAQPQDQIGQAPPAEGASDQSGGDSNFVSATFNIRIGIHSGKVCAGIVGVKRPKFCLIGDTVNVASRMHTNSKANRIQVSSDTRELLRQVPGFDLEPRGRIEIKGKGTMETYWLESSY